MKFLITNLIIFLFFSFLVLPVITPVSATTTADGGIVTCGRGDAAGPEDCNFGKLIDMINNIITILMEVIAVGSVIVIIYAGGMTMWEAAHGKPTDIYKKMLWNVIIGFFFALCSWLIIKEIVSLFGSDALKPAINYVFS